VTRGVTTSEDIRSRAIARVRADALRRGRRRHTTAQLDIVRIRRRSLSRLSSRCV